MAPPFVVSEASCDPYCEPVVPFVIINGSIVDLFQSTRNTVTEFKTKVDAAWVTWNLRIVS
jgi:hypothetical protein